MSVDLELQLLMHSKKTVGSVFTLLHGLAKRYSTILPMQLRKPVYSDKYCMNGTFIIHLINGKIIIV